MNSFDDFVEEVNKDYLKNDNVIFTTSVSTESMMLSFKDVKDSINKMVIQGFSSYLVAKVFFKRHDHIFDDYIFTNLKRG